MDKFIDISSRDIFLLRQYSKSSDWVYPLVSTVLQPYFLPDEISISIVGISDNQFGYKTGEEQLYADYNSNDS